MPTLTVEYTTEAERLVLERAVAFIAEMRRLAQAAPDGQVLDACEGHALDEGRDLLRGVLRQAVQQRLEQAEAGRAAAWQAAAEQPARRLAQAAGDWELHVDAGKVNTTGGWRDVKVGVFARRVPGAPATAAEWDSRALPPPGARLVLAA